MYKPVSFAFSASWLPLSQTCILSNQNWKRYMYPSVKCSTVYNTQDMEATQMSISRWMDKEVVVHIHNVILLSYKKEPFRVSSNEVDEIGAYYTEWSKSERERQMLYFNAYVWNLERQYRQYYVQGNKGGTDGEQRRTDFLIQWEKVRVGWFERITLKHLHYHM